MKICGKSDSEDIRFYINGILHLRIPRDKNVKIQSWMESHTKKFIIEIRSKNHSDCIEYDNKYMWKRILKLLDYHI